MALTMDINAAYRAMQARNRREAEEEKEIASHINSMVQNVDVRLSYLLTQTNNKDVSFLKNWLKNNTNTKF